MDADCAAHDEDTDVSKLSDGAKVLCSCTQTRHSLHRQPVPNEVRDSLVVLQDQRTSKGARTLRVDLAADDADWKAKVARAMHAKSGKFFSNEFLDGQGEPQWASAEFMRITREMFLADLRKERLPKHNPYVGNFHRGVSVSNAAHPTWE